MTLDIEKIGQVSVPVHDLQKQVTFYRDVLELPFLFEGPNMAFFECGGQRILLSVPEDERYDHPSSIFYFQVKDIRKSYETLVQRDVETMDEPHVIAEMNGVATWMTFFKDPEGNIHALMSEVPVE